jgi:ATP-dependent DNA helicase RecG
MCLANSRGGTVVLGVEDAAIGRDAFTGTTLDVHEIRRYIFDTLSPGLTVTVDELLYDDARLIVVGVPAGATVHALSGTVRRRIGRSCMPLSPDQIAALHNERAGRDPSGEPSGRSVAEVDPVALDLSRRHLRHLTGDQARWSHLPAQELCVAMGVATEEGELLIAGEQLFCASTTEVVSYQHRASAGAPVDASEHLLLPLVTAFGRTLEHVAVRNRWDPLLLRSGQQLQLQWYPDDVVREALANAFVHRRLDLPDPVQVEHFDDSLAVTSSGTLVSGVTVDNILTTASRPRNRLLARAFRSLGLIEELGTGVGRMYRSMLRLGKAPPSFESTAESVRVTLAGGSADAAFARFASALDESLRDDVEALLVLRRLCEASRTSSADMAPLFQRSVDATAASLQRISDAEASFIEPVHASSSRASVWYRLTESASDGLASAVTNRRHSKREIAEKVVAHVTEHGRISNSDVRSLFGVGAPRASVILRDLVQVMTLERTSESSRGPGVEYGPGPLFEDLQRRFKF